MDDLSFVQDKRVEIREPKDRSEVGLPVTVEWTVEAFSVGASGNSFGVFVDRPPQPSGKTLGWLFRGDGVCDARNACPVDYMAQRHVYRTTRALFTVDNVVSHVDDRPSPFHEVTIVLLDGEGRRIGEGSWSVQFKVRREA